MFDWYWGVLNNWSNFTLETKIEISDTLNMQYLLYLKNGLIFSFILIAAILFGLEFRISVWPAFLYPHEKIFFFSGCGSKSSLGEVYSIQTE